MALISKIQWFKSIYLQQPIMTLFKQEITSVSSVTCISISIINQQKNDVLHAWSISSRSVFHKLWTSSQLIILYMSSSFCATAHIGYEPADLTVHPPPELPRVGSFFSYRCLVFPPKNVLKGKPVLFRSYLG